MQIVCISIYTGYDKIKSKRQKHRRKKMNMLRIIYVKVFFCAYVYFVYTLFILKTTCNAHITQKH
jgi:hypothetical protein